VVRAGIAAFLPAQVFMRFGNSLSAPDRRLPAAGYQLPSAKNPFPHYCIRHKVGLKHFQHEGAAVARTHLLPEDAHLCAS
jgi:hypothetical protein